MSRTVEENVVKMRFDNQEFDHNVEQSNDTLNNFKTTLTSLPTSIYIGISNALSRINLSDILGIAGTLAGIQMVKNAITGIGYTIQGVATSALRAVNSVFTTAINQINEGGKQRALNIANAKFQIEGLKLDVKTFMDAADYAVSGTAYGLDAAAKVASQLGASGITQLEELKKALRGVSGVAAMTNSSYEEIGHIFTVISSNGKLMTENLRSFSAKGLNVAAVLSKSLNKTEAEISSMVTHGEIDFKTFYTAMDEAFGEHAKDANKTFEGAMSNVRAALSRVGEGLWTPILSNSIKVFNELRLAINAFNASLKDTDGVNSFSTFADTVKNIFDRVANMIGLIRYIIETTDYFDEIGGLFMALQRTANLLANAFSIDYTFTMQRIVKNFTSIINVVKRCVNGLNDFFKEDDKLRKFGGTVQSLFLWITDFADRFLSIFNKRENSVFDTIKSWATALKSVFDTIKDILGIDRKSIEKIFDGVVNKVFDLIENLKFYDDRITKITKTFRGIASALDIVKMAVSAIVNFVKPVFNYIPNLVDVVLTITSIIGDLLYKIRNAVKESQLFVRIFDTIKNIVSGIATIIKNIGTTFFEAFFGDASKDTSFLDKLQNFIRKIGETISDAFNNLKIQNIDLSPVKDFLMNLADFATTSYREITGKDLLDTTVIGKIFEGIKSFFTLVSDFFNNHIVTIFTGQNAKFNSFIDFVKNVGTTIGDVLTAIGDVFSNFKINEIEAILIAALIWKTLDVVKEIAVAFFGFLVELAKIFAQDFSGKEVIVALIQKVIDKIFTEKTVTLMERIKEFVGLIKEVDLPSILHGRTDPEEAIILRSIAELLRQLSWFFVAIAASLFIIALIPADRVQQGVEILEKFVLTIAVMAGIFFLLQRVLPNLSAGVIRLNGITLNAFGGGAQNNPLTALGYAFQTIGLSLAYFAASLYVISKIPEKDLDRSVNVLEDFIGFITTILGLFAVLGRIFSTNSDAVIVSVGKAFSKIGLAMLFISIALALLTAIVKPGDETRLMVVASVIGALIIVIGLVVGIIATAQDSGLSLVGTGVTLLSVMIGTIALIAALTASIVALSLFPSEKVLIAAGCIGALIVVVGLLGVLFISLGSAAGDAPQAMVGMLAATMVLGAFAADIAAVGLVIGAAALAIVAFTKLVEQVKEIMQFLAGLDDATADRVVNNVVKLFVNMSGAVPLAIASMMGSGLEAIKALIPQLMAFASNTILPTLMAMSNSIIPQLIITVLAGIEEVLNAIIEYGPVVMAGLWDLIFGEGALYSTILTWLDRIWDDTMEWAIGRIPIWVQDIYNILITLIRAINDVLEGNWDELNTELQRLIDNTFKLINDLLLGEKTINDVNTMIETLIESLRDTIVDNIPLITDAFGEMGRAAADSLLTAIEENLPFDIGMSDWFDSSTTSGLSNPSRHYATSSYSGYGDNSQFYSGFNDADTTGISRTSSLGINRVERERSFFDKAADALTGSIGKYFNKSTDVNVTTNIETDPFNITRAVTNVQTVQHHAGYE